MKLDELRQLEATELMLDAGKVPKPWLSELQSVCAILEAWPIAWSWKRAGSSFNFRISPAGEKAIREEAHWKPGCIGSYRFTRAFVRDDEDERLEFFWLELRRALNEWGSLQNSQANAVVGAFREMHDNILQHSERPHTGICGFRALKGVFEFGVADAGVGLLGAYKDRSSLLSSMDAAQLLEGAVMKGKSRTGAAERGTGFSTLLRTLRRFDAEIRVRSETVSLNLNPIEAAQYEVELRQQSQLVGFVVSARLRGVP